MAIRFYTSTVSPAQTVSEIQQKLAEAGASRITSSYDEDGTVEAVEFVIEMDGRLVGFRLSADVRGMFEALKADDDVPSEYESMEQAARTAWRVLKEWLNAQLALQAANQARLDQLLLGYGITQTGDTIYERLVEEKDLLEPAP